MATTATGHQTFTGKVVRANDSGIILDTMPDTWLNKSLKGDAALVLPPVGQSVTAVVTPWKDRYYLQSITVRGAYQGRRAGGPGRTA